MLIQLPNKGFSKDAHSPLCWPSWQCGLHLFVLTAPKLMAPSSVVAKPGIGKQNADHTGKQTIAQMAAAAVDQNARTPISHPITEK